MEIELGEVQERFAKLLWKRVPVTSGELVKICEQAFGWKKPTTYTVLRKLCEKGLFQNEGGTVTALVSEEEFYAARSTRFVEDTFHGSLPAFLAAFTSQKKLSKKEVDDIQSMIDSFREER